MKKITKKIVSEVEEDVWEVGDAVCIKTGYHNEFETWGVIISIGEQKDNGMTSFKMIPFWCPMRPNGEERRVISAWFKDIIKFTDEGRYSYFHFDLKNNPKRNWRISFG